MNPRKHLALDREMLRRVCGEFMEMPGLRLTCAQAQRLWGLDESTCREVLAFLVDARFLYQPRLGMYMRSDESEPAGLLLQLTDDEFERR